MQFRKVNSIFIDIATVLVTIYGFFELIKIFFSKNLYVGIAFLLLSLFIAFYRLLKELKLPVLHQVYQIEKTEYVVTLKKTCDILVDESGKAQIASSKEILLLNRKGEDELFDLLYASNKTGFSALNYKSEDIEKSYVVERIDRNKFKIRWKPKEKAEPLRAIRHVFTWEPVSSFNDPINYFQLFPDNLSAKQVVQIKTTKPIVGFIAFKHNKMFKTDNCLYSFAFNKAIMDCAQPLRITDYELKWEVDNIETGAIYTCVFYYDEGIAIKNRLELSTVAKLSLLVRNLFKKG